MSQCSSCGGFCGNRCLRDFSDRALNSAVFWQNRCCDLLEIIELFCIDAEQQYQTQQYLKPFGLTTPYPEFEGKIS
jgi:hypothetical protein